MLPPLPSYLCDSMKKAYTYDHAEKTCFFPGLEGWRAPQHHVAAVEDAVRVMFTCLLVMTVLPTPPPPSQASWARTHTHTLVCTHRKMSGRCRFSSCTAWAESNGQKLRCKSTKQGSRGDNTFPPPAGVDGGGGRSACGTASVMWGRLLSKSRCRR